MLDYYYIGFFRDIVVHSSFCVDARATRFTWDYNHLVLPSGPGKLHHMGLLRPVSIIRNPYFRACRVPGVSWNKKKNGARNAPRPGDPPYFILCRRRRSEISCASGGFQTLKKLPGAKKIKNALGNFYTKIKRAIFKKKYSKFEFNWDSIGIKIEINSCLGSFAARV